MLGFWKNRSLQWLIIFLLLTVVKLNSTDKATIQWVAPPDVEWSNVRLRSLDLKPEIVTSSMKVIGIETPAFRPRSGHWAYEVQVCKKYEGKDLCSEWIKSNIEGKPEPWIIFWKPPLVTGLGVEDEGGN